MKTIQTILLFVSLLQAKPINGKIKNDGDVYLENVNIIILPSREGTQSDSAGSFALSTSQNDKFIIISHIGYISDTIEIASFNDELLITLKEKSIVLDSLEVESKIWGKTSYFSKKKYGHES